MYTEYVCTLSAKKIKKGQYFRMSKTTTLATYQAENTQILVLTYKCLYGQGPTYLIDLLQPNKPTRPGLRSSAPKDSYLHLSVPRTKCKTFADRSFSVGAPTLWNSLPWHIKEATSMLTFKNMVMTHLFKKAFPDWPSINNTSWCGIQS